MSENHEVMDRRMGPAQQDPSSLSEDGHTIESKPKILKVCKISKLSSMELWMTKIQIPKIGKVLQFDILVDKTPTIWSLIPQNVPNNP